MADNGETNRARTWITLYIALTLMEDPVFLERLRTLLDDMTLHLTEAEKAFVTTIGIQVFALSEGVPVADVEREILGPVVDDPWVS